MTKENEIIISKGFLRRLSQFYPQECMLEQAIQENLPLCSDKADLFRLLTQGMSGKPHYSDKPEGKKKIPNTISSES